MTVEAVDAANRFQAKRVSACVLLMLLSTLLTTSPGATGQQTAQTPRVGLLNPAPPVAHFSNLVLDILAELGYEPGRNLFYTERWAGGSEERLRRDAAELASLRVNAIQAGSSAAVRAALGATKTIPIVAVDMESDPVANGWAASLAVPGGNLTGFFLDQPELSGKRLGQLQELIPGLLRVAVLWDASLDRAPLRATEVAARSLSLRLIVLEVRSPNALRGAFATAVKKRAQAVLVMPSPLLDGSSKDIASLALENRLPIAGAFPFLADAGFLYTYGPDVDDLVRRSFIYIDRILKGEKPSNLPIQRPAKFDFVLNFRTAAALGINFPESFLIQASRSIR